MRVDLPSRRIWLDAEWYGVDHAPVLVLIMGLGMQRIAWPAALIESLVAGGYRVLTFDNRDIGLSGSPIDWPAARLPGAVLRYLARRPISSPYTLDDMALDTVALLDQLGVARFSVAGVSMGGMIAQQLCLIAPERVRRHVSIMSSAGPRAGPFPDWRVLLKMLGAPRANAGHSDIVEHYVGLFTTLGRHRDRAEIDALRQRFDAAIRRAYRPEGTRRQLLAVCASPDRRGLLGRLTTPSLVIHGDCDPLVPLPAGRILANAIPNASLSMIPGMGHDLPSWALGEIASQILAHLS